MSDKEVICDMIMRIQDERVLKIVYYFIRNFVNKEDKTA